MSSINGILLVDKPSGRTSHDVVYKIRKHLRGIAVGHAGTLDPLASGLLVLLLGEGTKLSRLILSQKKTYHVKVKLGLETDSWDTDGKTINSQEIEVPSERIESEFLNTIGQKIFPLPIFSAVKVNGKKLYEYARKDIEVEVPERNMNFFDHELVSIDESEVEFKVSCDKGGYIRSIAHVLGKRLGAGGCVSFLRRTGSYPYGIEDSTSLESLLQMSPEDILSSSSYSGLHDILNPFKGMTVSGRDERLMMNGAIPNEILRRMVYDQKQVNKRQEDIYIKVIGADQGRIISLLHIAPNTRPKVFRTFT